MLDCSKKNVLVRGAGDIASGIIWSLAYAGFRVAAVEVKEPSCIRTEVSFANAVYEKSKTLDGVTCQYVETFEEVQKVLDCGLVPLIVDPECKILSQFNFDIVIDAILAKKNTGTRIDMAKVVIGIGPGFTAGVDCNFVIETMRGHMLGKIYEKGPAMQNTGVPGVINGYSGDRVMYSPCDGIFCNVHKIGDIVKKGEVISRIKISCNNGEEKYVELTASISGLLRGILHDGFYAKKGLKCADIDPRLDERENAFTISDKARAIGNSTVTAVMRGSNNIVKKNNV